MTDPSSWRKLPRPWFTGGGHGSLVDTPAGTYLVYHRKLGSDPGWADREMRWTPLTCDAGYPVVRPSAPLGSASAATPGEVPGLAAPTPEGLDRVA